MIYKKEIHAHSLQNIRMSACNNDATEPFILPRKPPQYTKRQGSRNEERTRICDVIGL